MTARVGGVLDLAAGAMVFVLATGLGLVAPAVIGGFVTALLIGLAGAVSLGLARSLRIDEGGRAPLMRAIAVTVARIGGGIGHLLVLSSATGLLALTIVAGGSLALTLLLLAALWVRTVRVRRA